MRWAKFIIIATTTCFWASGTRAAVELDYEGGYNFYVAGTEYGLTVHGREVTPEGQNVYVEFHFYAVHSACPDETNSLCCDDIILLENGEGVAYEPLSAHIVLNQALFETSRPFVKYKYAGDFAGPCTLVVKLGGGKTARLDMGPADYDFYRTGTVTAREGVDVRVAPNYASPVLCHLRRGDTFYFTGRNAYFWPYPDLAWYDCVDFDEVIYGGARGWLESYNNQKRLEYDEKYGEEPPDELFQFVETGPFAPRYVAGARAGTPGSGEEDINE
jgi:hypothetical protein